MISRYVCFEIAAGVKSPAAKFTYVITKIWKYENED